MDTHSTYCRADFFHNSADSGMVLPPDMPGILVKREIGLDLFRQLHPTLCGRTCVSRCLPSIGIHRDIIGCGADCVVVLFQSLEKEGKTQQINLNHSEMFILK